MAALAMQTCVAHKFTREVGLAVLRFPRGGVTIAQKHTYSG